MRILVASIASLVCLSFMTGCMSFSAFQTGRNLKKGEGSGFVGLGYESLVFVKKTDDEVLADAIEDVKVPVLEGGFRYGFEKGFDAGIRSSLIGTTQIDGKFNLTNDAAYAQALGVGLGYTQLTILDSKSKIYELHVPWYHSYDVSNGLTLYGVPRGVYRLYSYDYTILNETKSESVGGLLVGGTGGLLVSAGGNVGFAAEVSYFSGVGQLANSGIYQFMLGMVFGLENMERPAPPSPSASRSQKTR